VSDAIERLTICPPRRAKGASSWSSPIRVRTRSSRGLSARRRKGSHTRHQYPEAQIRVRGAAPKKPPA
jgi:hypothetical protein